MTATVEETAAEAAGMLARSSGRFGFVLLEWGGFSSPVRGLALNRINLGPWYFLGKILEETSHVKLAEAGPYEAFPLFEASRMLAELEEDKTLAIPISRSALQELRVAIDRALHLIFSELTEELDPQQPIERERARLAVSSSLSRFETVLRQELRHADVYAVKEKRIYSTRRLVDNADEILGAETRSVISEKTSADLREAGRCLAFELPTAAGFHAMRATERALREWHKAAIRKRTRAKDWRKVIDALREVGAHEATLAALDRLRELHRNPIAHPEVFLTLDEALDLFGAAESAISSVARQIKKLREKGSPEPTEPELPSGQSPDGAQS
jgi:hypothetical protein